MLSWQKSKFSKWHAWNLCEYDKHLKGSSRTAWEDEAQFLHRNIAPGVHTRFKHVGVAQHIPTQPRKNVSPSVWNEIKNNPCIF